MIFEVAQNQEVRGGSAKNFPTLFPKILQGILARAAVFGLAGCCALSTASLEARSTLDPVVAPAGTVLRVRLGQTLDNKRSRPGDRFQGVLDSPVVIAEKEVLPKGTTVAGHIVLAREVGRNGEAAILALTLDCYQRGDEWRPLSVSTLARTVARRSSVGAVDGHLQLPAETIVGFTLKQAIAE